jgi:pSer/pThr/pTyr-binding forkhead associated (FHA) protein
MAHEQPDFTATAYLVIRQGPQAGKRLEICKDVTTIGRSRDRDIFLEDVTVHRKQASIIALDTGYLLRDDHGNGDCIVNGQPVTERLLSDGDILSFGNTQLAFFMHDATRPFQQPTSRGRELHIGKPPGAGASSIARLDVANLRGIPRSIELHPLVTIGRSRDCSIFLEDLAVSRLHATIRQLPDGNYELEDHHSATGTFVNGQQVSRCRLSAGDVVQIGTTKFIFRL